MSEMVLTQIDKVVKTAPKPQIQGATSTGGNLYQIDSSYFACRNVVLINKILSPDKKRLSMSSN